MKKLSSAVLTVLAFLATWAAPMANATPTVSQAQLDIAHSVTWNLAHDKCNSERRYMLVSEAPVLVGHCEQLKVLPCLQNMALARKNMRRIMCQAMFVIHDRMGPLDGRVEHWIKLYSWAVPAPAFGWLFAHQSPNNPWTTDHGVILA